MRFTISATAILAMAVSALAQTADFNPIYKPERDATVNAGSTFEITWEAPAKYTEGTVSIQLIGGATQGGQVPILEIAAGVPNAANKYSWAVPSDLGKEAVYGLVIRYESSPDIFQYSNPFHIKAAAAEPTKAPESSSAPAPKPTGSADVTTTVHSGAVTVTLSSCTTSEVPVTTSQPPVISTPIVVPSISVPAANTTFSTKPVVPPTTVVLPPAPSGPAPPVQTPPGSGAASSSASVLALVGAAAMAMLAL